MKRWALLFVFTLPLGCSTSATTPADGGVPPSDAPGGSDAIADAANDVVVGDGTTGSCVIRPACAACYDAGTTCCLSPNPSPPPEYATACNACPTDSGATSVTLQCGGDIDCPGGVCCITKRGTVVASACSRTCAASEAQLCDTSARVTKCPTNMPCSSGASDAWNIPHCYGTCGPTPPP
jgi:hypothetical protein